MFSAVLGAATGLLGASSASSAASAQADAAEDQLEFSREQWEYQKKALEPYRGNDIAINALMYELGLGPAPVIGGVAPQINRLQTGMSDGMSFDDWADDRYGDGPKDWDADPGRYAWKKKRALQAWEADGGEGMPQYQYEVGGNTFDSRSEAQKWADANPTGGTTYQGYQKTPGYDFRLKEGRDAVQSSVGVRHGLNSGASMTALERYGQNFATNEHQNHLNWIAGTADRNQAAATGQVSASQGYTTNANNALANYGNAQASGAIGVGNALVGGINNGVGLWAYGKEAGWS